MHYAAHEPIDVRAIDADVLLCSPYKFCGPHLGMAYGRESLLETLAAVQGAAGADDAARRAASRPARCPTSCSPASTRRSTTSTRSAAWTRSSPTSARSASASSRRCPSASTVYGLPTLEGRVPTFLLNVDGVPAAERRARARPSAASASGRTTAGTRSNLYPRLGYDDNAIRVGFIHYNTAEEVDRFVGELPPRAIAAA